MSRHKIQAKYFTVLTAWLPIALCNANSVAARSKSSVIEPSRLDRQSDELRRSPSKQTNQQAVPVGDREVIADIVVRFVDEDGNLTTGKTNPDVITREFSLQPGDVYDRELAEEGLQGVLDLQIIDRANLSLEPVADNRAVMAIAVRESSSFFYGFGLTLPPPTALQGPVRPNTVNALSNSATGIAGGVRVGLRNLGGNNQQVSLGVEGGAEKFGFDVGYRRFFRRDRGIGINLFNRRGVEPEFDEGERDLDLENNSDPWVHRLGVGIEYFQPIGKDFPGAIGISYQRVSVRDGAFSDDIAARDELGNRLVVSDDGQDDLLTLNFAAFLDRRNDPENPTDGYQLKFGGDLYFPVGEANIVANRLAANYTRYIPFSLFGFSKGAKTLVFNLQGGTILGDAIPYDAFILGGSVRGYGTGEIGTGRSFIQATTEYRYPIFGFNAFNQDIDVGGTLFVDYATDLGSADAVIGQPAVVRDKPGDGLGYGFGLRTLTPIGAVRTEFAFNDEGDTEFIFSVGDRF